MNSHDNTATRSGRGRVCLILKHVLMGIACAALLLLVFGYIVMRLWNGILPDLLAARQITFWQSVGLLLLARILVGGFHHGHGHTAQGHGRREPWRQYDDWWNEVGRHSYHEFARAKREAGEEKMQ